MALATVAQIPSPGRTGLLSDRGQKNSIKLGTLRRVPVEEAPRPLEAQLEYVQAEARIAVQNQVRYLGEKTRELNAAFARIFDIDAWDDGDVVASRPAIEALLRVTIALGRGSPQVTAGSDSVIGSWQISNSDLRVEARSDETIRWTLLHPEGRKPLHQGADNDSIERIVEAVKGQLGSQGEHTQRQ